MNLGGWFGVQGGFLISLVFLFGFFFRMGLRLGMLSGRSKVWVNLLDVYWVRVILIVLILLKIYFLVQFSIEFFFLMLIKFDVGFVFGEEVDDMVDVVMVLVKK